MFSNGGIIAEDYRSLVVIADATAAALIKQIVPYNAYHGCERCLQRDDMKEEQYFLKPSVRKEPTSHFGKIETHFTMLVKVLVGKLSLG
ncbi:unnamed protein product, partial [Allacma fusca]